MARDTITCDACGKQCKRVVAKLFIAPVKPGETRKTHSDYTAHADIGECCATKFADGGEHGIKWQLRKKINRLRTAAA